MSNAAGTPAVGSTFDDGAGHLLGEAAGGVCDHMNGALLTSPFYPLECLIQGILVNEEGRTPSNRGAFHGWASIDLGRRERR